MAPTFYELIIRDAITHMDKHIDSIMVNLKLETGLSKGLFALKYVRKALFKM